MPLSMPFPTLAFVILTCPSLQNECGARSTDSDMRIGLFISETGVHGSTIDDLVNRAVWAEDNGIDTGWVPHIPWSLDALTALAIVGRETSRIELGTGVVPTWSHHPYGMAQHA
ncbi:MAG: LLM class flavin-dependent oxidoreductase, partial [Actinobacteria bacterium]|nr:LLM class flavin-dependent oxidoreductase [Actinomycetota bacterium]